ncbi:hypothetical protein OE88DRAFT_1649752 [Heliocybe sulcata]|uniref:Uncharacterized protein n=1 Tax=Heliocybe sulcata TaxID=5364 RepID=A0A5C3NJ08_9AGAM|nr:hypothetical protein OE88DRAFT_1649752 [Heliocybe sulcata]
MAPRASRSSSLPPEAEQPTWPPPKSPLPPHRLAKLANALGVSIPLPAGSNNTNLSTTNLLTTPHTAASSLFPADHQTPNRRSPTPSAVSTSFSTYSLPPPTSKFLLHVIPPLHLPHDTEQYDDSDFAPAPSNASGYHTQFRRGTLVPLYPTLQSQLGAIAKEYALPSTVGMILYLISSTPRQHGTLSPSSSIDLSHGNNEGEEPGPRLSEEIWKLLWSRVARTEREESARAPNFGLGLGLGGSSQDGGLRQLMTPLRVETPQPGYPATPSPSTPSSTSDLRAKSSIRSARSTSQSENEPTTPDSSVSPSAEGPLDSRSESLDLPGLHSPSLIPILAKVEFDIDRRKAQWYEPWIRSRKKSMARRADSGRSRKRADSKDTDVSAPLNLELVHRLQTESSLPSWAKDDKVSDDDIEIEYSNGGYAPLSESPVDDDNTSSFQPPHSDDDVVDEEDHLPHFGASPSNRDPLEDVFGSDADTWADIHNSTQTRNPHDLALDGAALAETGGDDSEERDDADEVRELWDDAGRPRLSVSIPSVPPQSGSGSRRTSSPKTAGTIKKHVPPPLDLPPVPGDIARPERTAGSTRLAYLSGEGTPSDSEASSREQSTERRKTRTRSDTDERREGVVFEDLDLGLDVSVLGPDDEYDENDPYDRRKSQYLMRAKLDEIEKALAQLSPRQMNYELAEEGPVPPQRYQSLGANLAPPGSRPPPAEKPSPRPGGRVGPGEASWPAVPYSMLSNQEDESPPPSPSAGPVPPRLTVNGISRDAPKIFSAQRSSTDSAMSESAARKRELEEEGMQYPGLTPHLMHNVNSPVIPLSPDPFGRFPSMPAPVVETAADRDSQAFSDGRQSSASEYSHSRAPSSRFSSDSIVQEEADIKTLKNAGSAGASLVSVKSIKKLWRKSNKNSVSAAGTSSPNGGRLSPQVNAMQNGRQEMMPPPPRPNNIQPMPSPSYPQQMAPARRTELDVLHFNQESPYPMPMRRASPYPPRTTPSPQPSYFSQPPSTPNTPPVEPPQGPTNTPGDRGSVRKSILKHWKSSSMLSGKSEVIPEGSATEQFEPTRKRRPSILGLGLKSKASISSLSEIPPSPNLPEEFVAANRAARRSQQSFGNGMSRVQMTPTPTSSMQSSPPRRSPFGSPPMSQRPSYEDDDGHSFDASQFEIVSPKLRPEGLASR